MTKRSILPQHARHILVYDEDWEYLMALYSKTNGAKPVGVSVAIRQILHVYVRRLKAREQGLIDEGPGVSEEAAT